MQNDQDLPIIATDDFARRFSMRGGNLMWFLGAGASAAANIPTAWDMIWEFKQQLFISQRRVSPKVVADYTNPAIQRRLQGFIGEAGKYPTPGAPDEYAALFEAAYSSESDRRTYIQGKLAGAKLSYGHAALATLIKGRKAQLVWTTNFDPLIADGCARVFGSTGQLTTITIESGAEGRSALDEGRWPLEVKLHGDFRSRRLKNTTDELREQDAKLRELLIEACARFGMIVAGYSGRDDSIMDTLEEALERPGSFPSGLFWLNRGDGAPLPRVAKLLLKAKEKGVESGLVPIQSFDEILRDLIRISDGLDTGALNSFASERAIWSPPPKLNGKRGFPVIRLNAIEVTGLPSVCRLVRCDIGGSSEVVKAIQEASVDVIGTRIRDGVIAFGLDADLRKAFAGFSVESLDVHPIESRRLRYDSQERGLLREALSKALARQHGMTLLKRRSSDLLTPIDVTDARWGLLKRLVGSLAGTVPLHPTVAWREGVAVRLDWADGRMWLLVEPRIVFPGRQPEHKAITSAFGRERSVKRYNRVLNDLLVFWTTLLAAGSADLRTFGVATGVDVAFQLGSTTAFSRQDRPS